MNTTRIPHGFVSFPLKPYYPIVVPGRTYISAAILVATVCSGTFFLYQIQSQTPDQSASTQSALAAAAVPLGTVNLASQAMALATTTDVSAQREIHIADNGLVLLRGVRIVSVSGDTIYVQMKWNFGDYSWSITTDPSTKYIASNGEKESLASLKQGELITVTGQLTGAGTDPAIVAGYIRE